MQDYILCYTIPSFLFADETTILFFPIFVQQMLSKYHVILYPFKLQHELRLTKLSFYFNIFESTKILETLNRNTIQHPITYMKRYYS